jgi:predicted ester cyclase
MTTDDNRARVLELFEVVINQRDTDSISRFTVNPQIVGTLRALLGAFSDLRFEVQWIVAEGARVVAFVDITGTHDSGPFLMVSEPTHQRLITSLVLALELDDNGMIIDNWLGTNFIAMLDQLGWGVAPRGHQVPV